jgi:hypothetical protein
VTDTGDVHLADVGAETRRQGTALVSRIGHGLSGEESLSLKVTLHRVVRYARGKQYQFGDCAAAAKKTGGEEFATYSWTVGFTPGPTQVAQQSDGSYTARSQQSLAESLMT